MKLKISLVTFPIDFGNVTLQNNFLAMLQERSDVVHHVFSPRETPGTGARLNAAQRVVCRVKEMAKLRQICKAARRDDRIVIFQQISPALFSLPFLKGVRSYIMSDWTRKLYEPILGEKMSSGPVTWLHSTVLKSVTGVLTFTDAAAASLTEDYGVSQDRIHKIHMPFDVLGAQIAAPNIDQPVRLLFVGGDFYRKGGDGLVRWFEQHSGAPVELAIMTQSEVSLPAAVRVIRNDPKESAKSYFGSFDLFVLPTRCDAYPQAIGEAASAGLGIVTTNKALGAPEVIDEGLNGHIVESEEQLFACLSALVEDRQKVECFKAHSRAKLVADFTFDRVFSQLEHVMLSNINGLGSMPPEPLPLPAAPGHRD